MPSFLKPENQVLLLLILVGSVLLLGCGGGSGGNPVDPGYGSDGSPPALTGQVDPSAHHNGAILWGLWDIYAHPDTGLEIVPLRGTQFQTNVTRFLQPPDAPLNLLSLWIDGPACDFSKGIVHCEVTIDHPFPGTRFWGFDVRGIVVGSPAGEVKVLNHDGYTRWWNPVEFTSVGKIFGYTEGALAPPGPTPETILHPYKYFADSLGPDDPMVISPSSRGAFNPDSPGYVTRRYELQFPTPGGSPDFHFKYAVTSSYLAPDGSPPWEVDDFPYGANQAEAYQLSVLDTGSTLYSEGASSGGDLKIQVTVYDWQKPSNPTGMAGELAALIVESEPLGLPPTDVLGGIISPGPDINSVCYDLHVPDLSPVTAGWFDLWVTAESANVTTYAPDIPGISDFDYPKDAVLSAYNLVQVEVDDEAPEDEPKSIHLLEPNGGEIWEIGTEHDIEWESEGPILAVRIEYSLHDDAEWLEIDPSTPNDGIFEWTVPNTPTETARVRVSDVDDEEVDDISDCHFQIAEPDLFIYVDNSSTSPDEYGTMADPFKTITAAISVAMPEDIILVDDSGDTYTESVVLTEGITLFSENWDTTDGGPRASIQTPDHAGACTVRADGVSDATISGFDIRPGGSMDPAYPLFMIFIYLTNCTNITVADCYFHGEEMPRSMVGVYVVDCSDIEICCSHFEHLHGPDPLINEITEMDWCIRGENTPNMYIHNVRMNDLGTNFNIPGHIVDAVILKNCDNPVIHNNLVYRIQLVSDGQGAALVTGFSLEGCENPILFNNTVNFLDTLDNFFINQAFCYFLVECPNGVFYNNIASNVTESGWAPDGSSLGRGVQSYLYSLPCDYTLIWNIEAPYFQEAFPNEGCVEAQPLFVDPENGLHDIQLDSEGQLGNPVFVDWDDTGSPSGDPLNTDPNTRSRMGCHGGPYGGSVGTVS